MPQKYSPPHQQLLGLAREARAEGLTFEEFWGRAFPEPMIRCRNSKCRRPVVRGKKCRACGVRPMRDRVFPGDSELYIHVDEKGRERLLPSKQLPRIGDEAPKGAVLWPRDSADRGDAYDAIWYSLAGWRAAYEDADRSPTEIALARMAPFFEDEGLLAAR